MNAKYLLNAMEGIQDTYIVSAQKRLGYIAAEKKTHIHSLKRAFAVALAAVLVLMCTVAAAMAVSPEFREAIISLFQLGAVEQVPDVPESGYEVKQITIGGQVSAQYVRTDGYWPSDGETLLRQWDDGEDRFWDVIDGQLVEVGTDPRETVAHLRWRDVDFTITLHTFVYKGLLYTVDTVGNYSEFGDSLLTITPDRLGSRTDVVVLRGESYVNGEYRWFWICDLETGEVRDVLAGCGIEELGAFQHVQFAEDLEHALVRAGDSAIGSPYLVDLEKKTCAPLGQLMDLDISTDFGSYEVSFDGNDKVLLAMAPVWRPEPTSVWTYHIPSGTVTPTVVNEEGLAVIDSEYAYDWVLAQKVDENGGVTIVDLRTGSRVKLEGITAGDRCYLKANSSQTKLLWVDWVDNQLDCLGVIDLENGEFTAFEREGMELCYDEAVFWLGDDRVATMMNLHTGEAYNSYPTNEYYLCIYKF